jgi:hypothetical protein
MQESPGSDRETIETYSLLSQTSVKKSEITCTTFSKKLHDPKENIHEHKSIIHRENNTNHEIESKTLFY